MNLKKILCAATIVLLSPSWADVKPAQLFTDDMVIQRDTLAPIWGWADVGEKVTVTASWGKKAVATANENGKWMVKLQTPAAGGPYTLTFNANNTVRCENVLSGDVWLCSGQSNMQMPVSQAMNAKQEVAQANFPNIRHFAVTRISPSKPAKDCKGDWKVCSPKTVKTFSATAYFTGRELHRQLNIPIGLVTSAWGSTCIEAWTQLAEQKDDSFALERKKVLDQKAKKYCAETENQKYTKALAEWKEKQKVSKKRLRKPRLEPDPREIQSYPGNLYNGMIYPLIPFAIKGVVWYQGEANTKLIQAAEHYRVQLACMINSWRAAWGQEIPFYPVQLPNYKEAETDPIDISDKWASRWPALRESISYVASTVPNVATSTMIDLGEAKNIHPKNKQGIGHRMASTILNKTYGMKTPTTPFMKSFSAEGNKIVIHFDYTGTGLIAKGGKLKSFAIAGADKQFVWADARIERRGSQDVIVVSSDNVKSPQSVRYAWAYNPSECNLYSKEGFPASPFRTDDWPLPK